MSYQVAVGNDNAGGLADISVQPRSERGIQWPEHNVAADYTVSRNGAPFIVLEWSQLTRAQYVALLAEFGLTYYDSRAITIRIPGRDYDTFANHNATAVHRQGEDATQAGWLYRDVRIVCGKLVAI